MKRKLIKLLIFLLFTSGVGGYMYYSGRTSVVNDADILAMGFMRKPDVNEILGKIKVENAFINDISQKQELITMEVDLTSEIIWDDSWTDDWFHKMQKIVYHGKGKYSTDLNNIEKSDLMFDHDNNKVYVTISKPQISSIELDEMQTIVDPTENGIFRFGEIKLEAVEFNRVTLEAKKRMRKEMSENKLMETALANTEASVKALYEGFLAAAGFSDYTVDILWK